MPGELNSSEGMRHRPKRREHVPGESNPALELCAYFYRLEDCYLLEFLRIKGDEYQKQVKDTPGCWQRGQEVAL